MDIQRLNRSDTEKVYLHIRNMSGATMTANGGVCLDLGTTIDGVSSIKPAAASFLGWVGIADTDIADTGYGRAQVYGYRDSILLSHEGSSVTVTAGDALHIVAGQYGLNTSTVQALSTVGFKYVACALTATISAAAYTKGIIRCL
jgi:hypothetical protein